VPPRPSFRVGVRRRDDPDVHRDGPVLAEALERALLQYAQQLHLRGERDVAHSSRKIVPPDASSNRPFLSSTAPVKAPRLWPTAPTRAASREGGAVDGDEGAVPRGFPPGGSRGDHLFPVRSRRAQHRRARRRDAGHRGEDFCIRLLCRRCSRSGTSSGFSSRILCAAA